MTQPGQIGIYFHWPFCLAKCPYCDFNVHVQDTFDHERWANAYVTALEHYAQDLSGLDIKSVFFGGGTPSLMAPKTAQAVLERIHALWPVSDDLEITLEANPTSVEIEKLQSFASAGINRVSLGVQALGDEALQFLGRKHDAAGALEAIETARKVFDRYSFDLIYARPGQTLQSWEGELLSAIPHSDGHLSLYQLTIERNTPFYFAQEQGKFSIPDQDDAADFYNITQDILSAHNLPAYEISNHARIGNESRHNMIYWQGLPYIGIGPGAHGRLNIDGKRFATRDHHAPDVWLDRIENKGSGAHPYETLSVKDQVFEALMMGLRLTQGIPLARLNALASDWLSFLDHAHLSAAQDSGWLVMDEENMALSHEGRLRLNALIPYLLNDRKAA